MRLLPYAFVFVAGTLSLATFLTSETLYGSGTSCMQGTAYVLTQQGITSPTLAESAISL